LIKLLLESLSFNPHFQRLSIETPRFGRHQDTL
jgi:hypothetical protein